MSYAVVTTSAQLLQSPQARLTPPGLRPPSRAAWPGYRPFVATGGDALRILSAGREVQSLAWMGAVPGVTPLAVAGKCGPGRGYLRCGGDTLQWRAPGGSYGPAVSVSDGQFLVVDGDDADCWIRVEVDASELRFGEAEVVLADRYGGWLDDVTAEEAWAGLIETVELTLQNDSAGTASGILAWIDADTAGLEISADGVAWSSPTTEGTSLSISDIAAGATATLHVRRTIAAAADADPRVLAVLHLRFTVGGANHYGDLRGRYRVFNDAAYRIWAGTSPPAESDPYTLAVASLPWSTAALPDGTYYFSVSYFNGCIDSGFLPLGPNGETYVRLDVSGGVSVGAPPNGPTAWTLLQRGGGVVEVAGRYLQQGSLRATHWAIAYTTDGTDPPVDTPDATVAMPTSGAAILAYQLPAQAHGTVVKVRLQTKRGTSYSEDSTILSATVDAVGPGAPRASQRWPGRIPEPEEA